MISPAFPLRRSAALLAIFSAAACAESSVGASSRGPSPAAVSATLALDLRNPHSARENIHGDLVIVSVPGVGLALAVDGGAEPGTQDGYVDQVFVLQQEMVSTRPADVLPRAELHYAGQSLMVRAAGRNPLLFLIQGQGEPDYLPAGAAGAERLVGYGISRRTGAWSVELGEVTAAEITRLLPVCAEQNSEGVSAASTCDSGGNPDNMT